MHANDSREYLQSLSPMGEISEIQDIVDAVCHWGGAARGRRCTQRKMVNTGDRLTKAAIELQPAVTPFGPFLPAVQTGNLLFLSGMLPTMGHDPKFLGRVGIADCGT
jgi:hypothetical protein